MPQVITTERRMLRYNFTPEEHLANCAEMARLYDAASEMEGTHKSIKAKLKEDEENVNAMLQRSCRLVRDQHDFRETDCRWVLNDPKEGQKSCYRADTEVLVEVKGMESWEKQDTLKFDDKQEDLPMDPPLATDAEVAAAIQAGQAGPGDPAAVNHAAPTHAEKLAARKEETERKKSLREAGNETEPRDGE